MNESDTRLKLIDPAIMKSWDRDTQVFTEYYFTDGEIVVRGNMVTRKDKKKAEHPYRYRRGQRYRSHGRRRLAAGHGIR